MERSSYQLMPDEIIRRRRQLDPNMRLIWRMYYLEILEEEKQKKEIDNKIKELGT